MSFDNWLMKIPGFARSGFNRSLGRQCWEDSQAEERKRAQALVTLAEMVEDHTKMPHQHSDLQTRLYCLTERASEALKIYRGEP